MDQVRREEDYAVRADKRATDEIGVLADGVPGMMGLRLRKPINVGELSEILGRWIVRLVEASAAP